MSLECITDDRLRDHLEGQLHGAEEAQVIAHLDACDRCQATLDGLAADTLILNVARESGRVAPESDPTLDRLLSDLQDSRGALSQPACEPALAIAPEPGSGSPITRSSRSPVAEGWA